MLLTFWPDNFFVVGRAVLDIVGCLATIPDLYPLEASRTLSPSSDNPNLSQTLLNVPRKMHGRRWKKAGLVTPGWEAMMQAYSFLKIADAKNTGILKIWELDAEFHVHVHLCICGYLCFKNWEKQAATTRMAPKLFFLGGRGRDMYNYPHFSQTLKQGFSVSALLTSGSREFLVCGPAQCIVGCWAASQASSHQIPVPIQVMTTKMFPNNANVPGGWKWPWLKSTVLDRKINVHKSFYVKREIYLTLGQISKASWDQLV